MTNLTEHKMERATTPTVARLGVDASVTYAGGSTIEAVATLAPCDSSVWTINRKKMQNVALHPFRWPPDSTA